MENFFNGRDFLSSEEKIKNFKKEKYTIKDVDDLCELLGLELFSYQKVLVLLTLNEKRFPKENF